MRTSNLFSILSSHYVTIEHKDKAILLIEKIARVLKDYPYGDIKSSLLNENERDFLNALNKLFINGGKEK